MFQDLIALCLACAIVGGGVSGGAVALASRSQKASTASGTSTVLESDRTATTNVQTQKVQAGDAIGREVDGVAQQQRHPVAGRGA